MLEISDISVNSEKNKENNKFQNDFNLNFDNDSICNENENDISLLLQII